MWLSSTVGNIVNEQEAAKAKQYITDNELLALHNNVKCYVMSMIDDHFGYQLSSSLIVLNKRIHICNFLKWNGKDTINC